MGDRLRTGLAVLALGVMGAAWPLSVAAQQSGPVVLVEVPRPDDRAVQTAPDEAAPDEAAPDEPAVQSVLDEVAVDINAEPPPELTSVDTAPDEPTVDTAVETAPDEPPVEDAVRTARDEASIDPAVEAASDETEVAAAPEEPSDEADEEQSRSASNEVRQMVAWVNATADNGGLPFIIIDKAAALVFVFDAQGVFLAATPALLGAAYGDDSTPGIGDVKLSEIPKEERVTPAGRFLAAFGYAAGDRKVLWVDFETAISLHPVVNANRQEQRLDRLYSASAADNRITYGCINIPAAFYEHLVRPLFTDTSGVVYILPEIHALDEIFPTLHTQAPAPPREAAVSTSASAEDPVAGEVELLHAR